MANGAGKKRRGAKAPKVEQTAPPLSEVTALELPGAPALATRAEVSALQLPGAPPPRTQPAVDTTRRLHGVLAPSQSTSLQLPGAPHQLRHAEVARRPLAIVPAHAHVPPQVDVAWFRSFLEVLRGRFPWPVVGRIIEALQGAWASVNAWWRGPPPEFAVLAVAAPELKKKNKNKNKNKNKKPVAAPVRHHTAWMFKKDALPDDQKKKKEDKNKNKNKNKKPVAAPVRHHTAWMFKKDALPDDQKKKKEDKNKNKNKNKKPVAAPVRHHTAWMFKKDALPDDQKKKKKKKDDILPPPAAADEPQPPVPVIIDGETVPAETVEGYKRYCRIARSSPATTTVCHLCIFDRELHPKGIVRITNMIVHCKRHPGVAVRCGRFGCAAKVPPGRNLREHTYFCHDLPTDWWRLP